jgi:2,3-dihydroxy-p-cumate/2,3-dihydroxybenzoate 3,4-dioxygenase
MARFDKLGHVALNVTDVARSRAFYENKVGLQYSGTSQSSGAVFLRCSDSYHNVALYPSTDPGLKHIGWEMESAAELDALAQSCAAHGIPFDELSRDSCLELHLGRTLRVVEPASETTHLFYETMWSFGGVPFEPTLAKIQRLGHIVLQVADFERSLSFYTDVLGFRISDRFGSEVAFMRAFPNPYHHSLAIGRGDRSKFHHVNFMVSEIDDIGRGYWRFNRSQIPIVHGPGRHPPSGSVFLYFLDPDGLTVEYSFGMETFEETGARKSRTLEMIPSSMDFWDATIDPRKGAIGKIEVGKLSI